jgi:hypothetical protein
MNGIEKMIESEGEQGWSNFVKTGKTGPKNVDANARAVDP